MGSCERGVGGGFDILYWEKEAREMGKRNRGVEDRRDEDLGKQIPSKTLLGDWEFYIHHEWAEAQQTWHPQKIGS